MRDGNAQAGACAQENIHVAAARKFRGSAKEKIVEVVQERRNAANGNERPSEKVRESIKKERRTARAEGEARVHKEKPIPLETQEMDLI